MPDKVQSIALGCGAERGGRLRVGGSGREAQAVDLEQE